MRAQPYPANGNTRVSFSPSLVTTAGKLPPCGQLTSTLLAAATELHAKWRSAQHPSCRGRKKGKHIGLARAWLKPDSVEEHGPLICKHFPFLELLSADAKQAVASAAQSRAAFSTLWRNLCSYLALALWFPRISREEGRPSHCHTAPLHPLCRAPQPDVNRGWCLRLWQLSLHGT